MRKIFLLASTVVLLAGAAAYAGSGKQPCKCTGQHCTGQQCAKCCSHGQCVKH